MVWIKYYFSLHYVLRTYQFLRSTPLWLSNHRKKRRKRRTSKNTREKLPTRRRKKRKVIFRRNMQQWKYSTHKSDKRGNKTKAKIDSDDNDNGFEGFCFFSAFRMWISFLLLFFLFTKMITTANFITTFPISKSVENYCLFVSGNICFQS